jgi:hypothetical protein
MELLLFQPDTWAQRYNCQLAAGLQVPSLDARRQPVNGAITLVLYVVFEVEKRQKN